MHTFKGIWHNQLGSELSLEAEPDGRLHGSLIAAAPPGEAAPSYPLVGFVRGDLIAFTVDFGRHGSLTSWVGHMTGASAFETLWHMSVLMPHPQRADERWKGTWSGADQFTRGPRPADLRARDFRMPAQGLWLV